MNPHSRRKPSVPGCPLTYTHSKWKISKSQYNFFNIQLIRGKITNFQFLTFSNISLGNINSLLNFISLCVPLCMGGSTHVLACRWKSEAILWESFRFPACGTRNSIRLSGSAASTFTQQTAVSPSLFFINFRFIQ